jgi:DNA-binding response OmpR family regulator
MSATMKAAITTIGHVPPAAVEPVRRIFVDDVLTSATAKHVLEKHPRPGGALPVLILIAESDFHDKASASKWLAARTSSRNGLELIVPGWLRELGGSSGSGSGSGVRAKEQEVVFVFGDVSVNVATMEVCRGGRNVAVKRKEFQLLVHMLKNPRRVITRAELLKEVWGYQSYPSTRTVDNHILRLRQKLEAEPAKPRHFMTIHGVGYRFLP